LSDWANILIERLRSGHAIAELLNSLVTGGAWDVVSSIRYGEGPRQTLDLYAPHDSRKAPIIVYFYGGNWQSGDKEMYRFLAAPLAAAGFVTIVPDYRIYPPARFPAFLEDGARAVHWIKQNAQQFGGRTDSIFLLGHSAGAYIAAMLALDRQWLGQFGLDPRGDLTGWIGMAGPYDFLPLHDPILQTIFGAGDLAHTQPISFVDGHATPVMLATGRVDRTVSPNNTKRLAASLRANGASVTEIIYPQLGHRSIVGAFAPMLTWLAPIRGDVTRFVRQTSAPLQATKREQHK